MMTPTNHPYLTILIVIGTYCALSTVISASTRYDLDIPSPEAMANLQLGDEASRAEVIQRLEALFRALSHKGNNNPSEYDYGSLGLSKRQIRYHQCYFNPISCFRRRK